MSGRCTVATDPDLLAKVADTLRPYECASHGHDIRCWIRRDAPDIELRAACARHDDQQAQCLGVVFNGLPLCEFTSG